MDPFWDPSWGPKTYKLAARGQEVRSKVIFWGLNFGLKFELKKTAKKGAVSARVAVRVGARGKLLSLRVSEFE